ncbi:MAG: hypothetical protein ACR2MX_17060, partial [Cyclobacteriaceae bacterium]
LIMNKEGESEITVDNLEVAQFIYLMLNNKKIRDVIDAITTKSVLILGRFTKERKAVLDALRKELRRNGYVPVIFDFDKPRDKDFTETLMTLAGMCLFIIADVTNPKSSPLELQATVPNYMTPFVPIIEKGEEPFSMFSDIKGKFPWVLDPLEYNGIPNLLRALKKGIIQRAIKKHEELIIQKNKDFTTLHADDFQE